MKLKLLMAEESEPRAKATVHSTGKLGFSGNAVKLLGIKEGKSIQFAQNEDDPNDDNLYAFVYGSMQEGAFRINKAGVYFYLNSKNFFDKHGVDYKNKKIIFDLLKSEYEGKPIFKMLRREINKKNKGIPKQ